MLRHFIIRTQRTCRFRHSLRLGSRGLHCCQPKLEAVSHRNFSSSSGSSSSFVFLNSVLGAAFVAAAAAELSDQEATEKAVNPEEVTTSGGPTTPTDGPTPEEIEEIDLFYSTQRFTELSEALDKYAALNNAAVLWRRARAEWEQVKADKKKFDASRVKVALDLVEQALLADETNSNAHRWKAILSNAHTEALGKRHQFLNLPTMKYHLERAIALNPRDSTAYTMLAVWKMTFVELSWVNRRIASLLGPIPDLSYEDVLHCLLKAEEVGPKAWNRNICLLGKVYYMLGDKEKAKQYIEIALSLPVYTEDDRLNETLAKEIAKKLELST